MSLSDQDQQDMVKDGLSLERREAFRVGRQCHQPKTFEDYIAMLDDLQQLAPAPPRPAFVAYQIVKL